MRPFSEPWGNYLLSGLVETDAPSSISWWPETLGWKILFIVFIASIVHKIYRVWQEYKRNVYRRDALLWLQQLPVYDVTSPTRLYRQLPALLRKTALSAFERTEVNQLSKQSWEAWLDQQCEQSHFVDNCPTLLHRLAYDSQCHINQEQMKCLVSEITLWIKYHRRQND
jgi:uncharacterized protein DUF4381